MHYVWVLVLLLLLSSPILATDVVPKVGVYISKEDIISARELANTKGWAKAEKDRIITAANKWVDVPDEYIRSIMPQEGAIFAYGIAGCPDHNVSWTNFGGNGIADLSRPLTLKCPAGHIIDFNNPESKYYDSGNGVYIDNRRFFFRGVWNAFVVNTFTGQGSDAGALHQLAYAYALTGEDQYAKKAAVIFDALAYLSPTTKGPRDFHADDKAIAGRLHFLTSIVHRSKVHFVRSFDLLYNNPAMQAKSYYNDQSIVQNVAKGILEDYMFVEFDLRNGKLTTMHNHESDELRGMLATGLVLGNPDYIRWGIQAASYFFENTIDRDGLYYEGSPSYANFTQTVFSDIAELAYYYNPENYDLEGLPERVNFYDHPKLREFLAEMRNKLDIAGHFASYGNASSDRLRIEVGARTIDGKEFLLLDQLYHRTEIPELKEIYKEKILEYSQGNPDQRRSGTWALFHVKPEAYPKVERFRQTDQAKTAYYAGPSLAILGSGEGRERRSLLIRGGPNLPHSHDDALALFYYDKGYLLTQDNGYNIFGSPLHSGWGSQAVSHNLVVVDNDKYRKGWYKNTPGAEILGFANLDGLKYVHLDAPYQFPTSAFIKEYSRRTALIDIDNGDSYVVDVFTVRGGQRHDYVFHTAAPILETDIEFNEIEGVWTLGGLDYPEASFNKEGQSWGERILPGDMIKDIGIPSEGVKSMYWNPAPQNGYGFIYKLQAGTLEENMIEARFKFYDGTDTTLTNRLFFDRESKLYKGLGPNLAGKEKYPYLILRSEASKNLESRVISIMDASFGSSNLEEVNRVDNNAFEIAFYDGQKHYLLLNGGKSNTPIGSVTSTAELALVKFADNELKEILLVGGGLLQVNDQPLLENKVQEAEIMAVDYNKSEITLAGHLESQKGELVAIDSRSYVRNTAYTIKEVKYEDNKTILALEGSLVLAKGKVEKGTRHLTLNVPLPTGFSYSDSTRYLNGKLFIREKTGEGQKIKSVTGFKAVSINSDIPFEPQDSFLIVDIKVGDILTTLPKLHWTK